MLILTSFPFCAAVCHSEKRSVFRPIFALESTRRRARLLPLRMESGCSATYLCHPSLVYAADYLAYHTAQKHYQEPGSLEDATDYKNNTTEKTATFIVTNDTGATLGADVTAGSPASVDSYSEIKAAGKGGTAPYKYLYYYRQKGTTSWKQISADKYSGTAKFSADSMGTYEILTKTYDYNGSIYRKISSVSFYKDTGTPLVNNSTISSSVINQGGSITLTAKAKAHEENFANANKRKRLAASEVGRNKLYL